MKKSLIRTPQAVVEVGTDPAPAPGQWYWVAVEEEQERRRWLGCILHVGSNYVELRGVANAERIHFDQFDARCTFVPDPDGIIASKVADYQAETRRLMAEVRALTARLGIGPLPSLDQGDEAACALVLRTGNRPVKQYKKALVRAKDKELPELFAAIKASNYQMSKWMKARLLPLEADELALHASIADIGDRVFNVELYAGLVETVTCVKDGEPAAMTTPIHLMQRRCYMDEECLAEYEAGGMTFKSIKAFDRWLARPKNFARVLPFPRCIVAFRVRRYDHDRNPQTLLDFINMFEERRYDKTTFLYIRNGQQLARLQTELEFGTQLFPDPAERDAHSPRWARIFAGKVDHIIFEGEHQENLAKERLREAEMLAQPEEKRWRGTYDADAYHPFSPESVYYDDIRQHIARGLAKHNRLVLILQGLLDRSPVLHPHPPWSLWTSDGFAAALSLVYDDSRALTGGAAPDFEAYRANANASLHTGSVTVGQEIAWERREAEKENARRALDHRHRSEFPCSRYRPYGDPGPGILARVQHYTPRSHVCTYTWERQRRSYSWRTMDTPIGVRFTTPAATVLHVDAYTPGDFRIFYADPRTRAAYLQWAPLLLLAEDYHAGKRKLRK